MLQDLAERLLSAAMKRRGLDTIALRALMHATHLLGLAIAERLRHYRESADPLLHRFAQVQQHALLTSLLHKPSTYSPPAGTSSPSGSGPTTRLRPASASCGSRA